METRLPAASEMHYNIIAYFRTSQHLFRGGKSTRTGGPSLRDGLQSPIPRQLYCPRIAPSRSDGAPCNM